MTKLDHAMRDSARLDAISDDIDNRAAHTNPWLDPMPLRRDVQAPEPFPIVAMGETLAGATREIIEAVQCPDALAAQSVLAGASLAAQTYADVEIDGRRSPLSEFFVTIGESGERKSTVDRIALRPHDDRQRWLRQRYSAEMRDYEIDTAEWKQAEDRAFKTKGRTARRNALDALGPAPIAPLDPTLTTEEPTYEGLIKALAFGYPSMGLFSDEGGRFLGGHAMSPEHAIKTAAGLSKLWDGGRITRTRAGEGHSVLYNRRLSLHLMVQPSISALLFGNKEIVGQGLLSRVLVAWPESTIGKRPYREINVTNTSGFELYATTMNALLSIDLPLAQGERNELNPRVLTLATDAKRRWIEFHDDIEGRCADNAPLAANRGIAAKAAEHAARLAGILTLVREPGATMIRLDEIEGAIKLAEHYVGEAQRIHESAGTPPEIELAEKVLAWAHDQGGRFATQTLYQRGPSGVRSKSDAEKILKILEDHGHARRLPAHTEVDGRPRKNAWEVR